MHDHITVVGCKHEFKYCEHCDVVYCEKCKKEWSREMKAPYSYGDKAPWQKEPFINTFPKFF